MKILTGRFRGRRFGPKPVKGIRPTAERVRQAIFDMLQGAVEGKRALDLFSGTGALGLEALSQGASQVTFVEQSRAGCRCIQQGLLQLDLSPRAELREGDAFKVLGLLEKKGEKFDLFFADPPYEKGLGVSVLQAIERSSLMAPEALVVLECRKSEALPERIGRLIGVRQKIYGDTKTIVYRRMT